MVWDGSFRPEFTKIFLPHESGVFYGPFLFIQECYGYSSEDNHECFTIFTGPHTSINTVVYLSHGFNTTDYSLVDFMESILGDELDRLKGLHPKRKVESQVSTINKILKSPHLVYGHDVVSGKDYRKLLKRVELLESKIKEIRLKLNLNDEWDKL